LYKGDVALPESPCLERRVYFHKRLGLFVEFSTYSEGLFVTFAINNGAYVRVAMDSEKVDEWVGHYEGLGFRQVGAWHISPSTVIWREYRDFDNKAVVTIDGSELSVGGDKSSYPDRESAEAKAEEAAAELIGKGYWLQLMEEGRARHENPPELTPIEVPAMREYSAPGSAFEAVDQAVAKMTEVHELFTDAHFVTELLDLPADRARLEALGHDDFFTEMHSERIGRWRNPPTVEETSSSYDYFCRRYGSMTWILGDSPDDISCFYCGNVSGGGWSPLEIVDDDYDTGDLAEATGEDLLTKLHVFHGGWHHGQSYAFDTRYSSEEGEHPIVHFDECEPEMLSEEPEEIQAFGYWLLKRVDELLASGVPWLASVQD
jgi:hypothetical protein